MFVYGYHISITTYLATSQSCGVFPVTGWKIRRGPKRGKDYKVVHANSTNWENGCSTFNSSLLRVSYLIIINFLSEFTWSPLHIEFCLSLQTVSRKSPTWMEWVSLKTLHGVQFGVKCVHVGLSLVLYQVMTHRAILVVVNLHGQSLCV